MVKVVVRIKGGLGNQLFCYAAARRLALVNGADLVVDDVSGFARDRRYARQYELDAFRIHGRIARPTERLFPFERLRRGILKSVARRRPFSERSYIEQETQDFDPRLVGLRIRRDVYLDGLWQGEGYFSDIADLVRTDMHLAHPLSKRCRRLEEAINRAESIAVHVRWFDAPDTIEANNVPKAYYERAIAVVETRVKTPRYFVFSDDPSAARSKLQFLGDRATFVGESGTKNESYEDLHLMSRCRGVVTANSTLSWWGAWLGNRRGGIVVAPDPGRYGGASWRIGGLLPADWTLV